ncbi:MAG: sigma-54-dependent Fis family transcriptional regulator [Rhodocyclaceae bacterium]
MELRLDATTGLAPRPALSQEDVARARQAFFECGTLPSVPVHKRILASWQRCLRQGMRIDRLDAPMPLARSALDEAFCRSEALRLLAEPELEFLTETLADTASQVILSDAKGLILDTRGDARAMNRATREALLPGISWSERDMGTNAIGTALAENHLIEIWGAEHFHDQHRRICCTAAPILDHTGGIVGLLDVSGDARLPRGYARSLVKRAVREIEHRWLLNAPERFTRLRFHPNRACVGSYQEGVLLIDDDRVVGANRSALRWLGNDWTLIGRSLREVFELEHAPADLARLRTRNGEYLYGQLHHRPQATRVGAASPSGSAALAIPVSDTLTDRPSARPTSHGGDPGAWLSAQHRHALERTRRAIDAGLSTVVLGETGCGKEVFARLAHAHSGRADGPFVAINCAALPETLIEAELFGYSEGAFTGARRKGTPGRILEADGGILFLDEIGDMPLTLQARLLRVLQERQVVPLGGGAARAVDCVVMCATHRDLEALVAAGDFRADLFYRLHDHQVSLPAWRTLPRAQRGEALARMWEQAGGPARRLTLADDARECLLDHDWPGNFRQLASTLRALTALADDGERIAVAALPPHLRRDQDPAPPPSLAELGDAAIRDALARHHGKVAAAARALGIHRATLYRRLRQMEAEPVATPGSPHAPRAGADRR